MRGLTVFSLLFRTIVLYAAVVTAMRCMGKRQLGQLQPGELVTTFLLSNVATICIDEPDLPLLAGLVPIFLLAALEILHAAASWRWPRYTRVLFGKPVTVILRGEVQQDSLEKLRISGRDLAEALRGQKIDTPARVLWAVMEPGGRLNAVPYARGGEPFCAIPCAFKTCASQPLSLPSARRQSSYTTPSSKTTLSINIGAPSRIGSRNI